MPPRSGTSDGIFKFYTFAQVEKFACLFRRWDITRRCDIGLWLTRDLDFGLWIQSAGDKFGQFANTDVVLGADIEGHQGRRAEQDSP